MKSLALSLILTPSLILALSLIVPLTAAPLHAQWMPGPAHDSAVARTLRDIPEGSRLRVALMRNRWVGSYQGLRGDTLVLGTTQGTPMLLRLNAVDSVWRPARGTLRGALLGAIAGVVVGGATAIAGESGWSFAAGGVGGTAAGALVGSTVRWWRREYP